MGDMRAAVDDTLSALDLQARDEAAAQLARAFADEIDQAEIAERTAERALRMAQEAQSEELEDLIRSLRTKAGHRDAIVRCGQRLESLLVQLGATPAARGKAGHGAALTPLNGPLALLRGGQAG